MIVWLQMAGTAAPLGLAAGIVAGWALGARLHLAALRDDLRHARALVSHWQDLSRLREEEIGAWREMWAQAVGPERAAQTFAALDAHPEVLLGSRRHE